MALSITPSSTTPSSPTSLIDHEGTVHAHLSFHVPGAERPRHYMYQPEGGSPQDTGHYETRAMSVINARHVDFEPSLDRQGFRLITSSSVVPDCDDEQWRPLRGPVLDAPLALCDASTLSVLDLNPAEVRYQERSGEIYLARYSSRQRWYYYSAMTADEVLIFKQYDTQMSATARFTPHGAFDPPALPTDVLPRHSIELRVLLIHH